MLSRLSCFTLVLTGAGVALTQTTAPGPTQPGTATNCNKWHIVKKGDDCSKIETLYDITHTRFLIWNPAVSQDCITNFWPDYAYCVGVGGNVVTTTSSTRATSTAKTTSSVRVTTTSPTRTTSTTTGSTTRITAPPGPTFTGTPANCVAWHLVVKGDDCSKVASKYGITVDTFLKYNPDVSKDCATNFWVGNAYCVAIDPKLPSTRPSSSSTRSSTTSFSFNSTYSIRHPTTTWVISTPVIDNSTWPPTKTQAGQPSYCSNWHLVGGQDDCASIVFKYKTWMSYEDFMAWNPAVGTDCTGLFQNTWVCVEIYPQTTLVIDVPATIGINDTIPPYVTYSPEPLPEVDPYFAPVPSHGPMPANCIAFERGGKPGVCGALLEARPEMALENFFSWNPVLNKNCANVRADNYYCVAAYSTSDSWPQPATVATRPSNAPSDTISSCAAWYLTTPGDTCEVIEMMFGSFSQANFKTWNPSVGSSCNSLKISTYYCVAVPGTPTTRTVKATPTTMPPEYILTGTQTSRASSSSSGSSTTRLSSSTSTTASGGSVVTPSPIQGTMIDGCRRFYFVQQGDGCWDITNAAGISLDDFYKWNPAAAPDCSGMWSNIWVCVGRSGPVRTFSGEPPRPT